MLYQRQALYICFKLFVRKVHLHGAVMYWKYHTHSSWKISVLAKGQKRCWSQYFCSFSLSGKRCESYFRTVTNQKQNTKKKTNKNKQTETKTNKNKEKKIKSKKKKTTVATVLFSLIFRHLVVTVVYNYYKSNRQSLLTVFYSIRQSFTYKKNYCPCNGSSVNTSLIFVLMQCLLLVLTNTIKGLPIFSIHRILT